MRVGNIDSRHDIIRFTKFLMLLWCEPISHFLQLAHFERALFVNRLNRYDRWRWQYYRRRRMDVKCLACLFKGVQDLGGAGVAIFRIRCYTATDNSFEGCRKRAGDESFSLWKTSGEHLVKDDTERVDIVAWSRNAIETFRGHIGDGAYLVTRRRQRRCGFRTLFRSNPKIDEAHIDPTGSLSVVEQDIAGFEVAVNNAPAMDVCYRLHQRGEDLSYLRHRQDTGLQALGQGTAGDVRRHQEESAIDLAKF